MSIKKEKINIIKVARQTDDLIDYEKNLLKNLPHHIESYNEYINKLKRISLSFAGSTKLSKFIPKSILTEIGKIVIKPSFKFYLV